MTSRFLSRRLLRACLGGLAATAPLHADDYTNAVLQDAPLVYLPLGNPESNGVARNSGTAGEALDGEHIGVAYGLPGAVDSSSTTAVFYDGGARTVVPYDPALNPPASESFTIEAWLRPTINGLGNAQAPLFNRRSQGNRQGWVFFQRADNQGWNFRMFNENGSSQSIDLTGGPYTVGFWSHVVLVWDGPTSTARLYVDGLPVGTQTGGYVANDSGIPLGIGAYSADAPGDNPYTGDVAEVAFYGAALSQAQIQEHYDAAFAFDPEESYESLIKSRDPVLYLRMGDLAPWRSAARNLGSTGVEGDGVHFPGARHRVPGALLAEDDGALGMEMIDRASSDGGYPTVLPPLAELASESFSWEAWVRPLAEGNGNAQCLVKNHVPSGDRTGWVIWQRASREGPDRGNGYGWNLRLYSGAGSAITANLITGQEAGGYTVGEWQHLAVTFDAASQNATFYVDGVAAANATSSAGNFLPNPPGTVPVGLGGFPNGWENAFEGELDEVAFYDRALEPAEVAARVANGRSATPEQPYAELVLASGPVAYYRMNDAVGNVIENLGTLGDEVEGTAVNAPPVILGPFGAQFAFDKRANRFDGATTFIDLRNPAGLNLTGEITLEAWVSPDPSQPNFAANIIAHGVNHDFSAEVFLRIEDGHYEVGANGGKASFEIPEEDLSGFSWVHLAGTWSDGQWRLYRNGFEVATGSDPVGAVAVNNGNWSVGARGRWKYGAGFPLNPSPAELRTFSGGISDAAIYDRALSAASIEAHYFGEFQRFLRLSRPGGALTLEWGGGVLQESEDLEDWTDLPDATSPYLPQEAGPRFFRLRD